MKSNHKMLQFAHLFTVEPRLPESPLSELSVIRCFVTFFTTFHIPCCIQQEVDITEDMTRTYLIGYSIA